LDSESVQNFAAGNSQDALAELEEIIAPTKKKRKSSKLKKK
jgi:hypothetical protein